MNAKISYDKSIFIEESISAVYTTIAEAVVLVVIVIFFFLRTLRATIIPLVTIPVSLIGAFAVMSLLGFSTNPLTLLSMVLAIGDRKCVVWGKSVSVSLDLGGCR